MRKFIALLFIVTNALLASGPVNSPLVQAQSPPKKSETSRNQPPAKKDAPPPTAKPAQGANPQQTRPPVIQPPDLSKITFLIFRQKATQKERSVQVDVPFQLSLPQGVIRTEVIAQFDTRFSNGVLAQGTPRSLSPTDTVAKTLLEPVGNDANVFIKEITVTLKARLRDAVRNNVLEQNAQTSFTLPPPFITPGSVTIGEITESRAGDGDTTYRINYKLNLVPTGSFNKLKIRVGCDFENGTSISKEATSNNPAQQSFDFDFNLPVIAMLVKIEADLTDQVSKKPFKATTQKFERAFASTGVQSLSR